MSLESSSRVEISLDPPQLTLVPAGFSTLPPPPNFDAPLSSSGWWRQGLQQENPAAQNYQAVEMERLKSLRASNVDPHSLIEAQTDVWVEETRKVSLSEFLTETPRRYGAHKEPFPKLVPPQVFRSSYSTTTLTTTRDSGNPDVGALAFDLEVAEKAIRQREAEVVFNNFEKLLQSNLGIDLLGEFMTNQMCAENLIFHEATTEVEQNNFPLPVVRNLIEHFIVHGADAMVNISGTLSKDIQLEMIRIDAQPDPTVSEELKEMLRQAREEVNTLMRTDIFPRFIEGEASKGWREACELAVLRLDGIDPKSHIGQKALERVQPPRGRKRFSSLLRQGSGLKSWTES
eukprot:c13748_g1_i2.p1 GENE.c13748_g1_i2~~c13748_g1_i2.p1  ORF type:complete len:395 (-),score=69.64 c13748_g1_i2:138-1172(-)